jgi:hypothetical protein
LTFGESFLCHLQKQKIRKFNHVLMVSNPVVLEDVTEIPKLGNNVLGGSTHKQRLYILLAPISSPTIGDLAPSQYLHFTDWYTYAQYEL